MKRIILSFILAIVATLTATAQDINAWLQEQLNASAERVAAGTTECLG